MGLAVLVIEGLTGSGKTSVLNVLKNLPDLEGAEIYAEQAALGSRFAPGDVIDELGDSGKSDAFRWRRLDALLSEIEKARSAPSGRRLSVVERFHLTYYALMPSKELVAAYDARLASLNAGIVLLTYPEKDISVRALHRPDRADSYWLQEMTRGRPESDVLEELGTARARYQEALAMSKLPSIVLDTSAMDWPDCARRVGDFLGRPESGQVTLSSVQ